MYIISIQLSFHSIFPGCHSVPQYLIDCSQFISIMPKQNIKKSKLYPLFCRHNSNYYNDNIANNNDDDDDNDDDLPLTSLLRSSLKKKSSLKEKKRRCTSESAFQSSNSLEAITKKKKSRNKNSNTLSTKESSHHPTSITHSTTDTTTTSNNVPPVNDLVSKNVIDHDDNTTLFHEKNVDSKSIPVNDNIRSELDIDRSQKAKKSDAVSNKRNNSSRHQRLLSDSAMDFIGQCDNIASDNIFSNNRCVGKKRNSNIVNKINARVINGSCLLHHHRCSMKNQRSKSFQSSLSSLPSCLLPKKWITPSWISLEQQQTIVDRNGNNVGGTIDHITWDSMGVLLAVASGRTISIYDWDMVRAADIKGRSERMRNCHGSKWNIPPIVQFMLPCPVGSLIWNPYNIDELAVGFR